MAAAAGFTVPDGLPAEREDALMLPIQSALIQNTPVRHFGVTVMPYNPGKDLLNKTKHISINSFKAKADREGTFQEGKVFKNFQTLSITQI